MSSTATRTKTALVGLGTVATDVEHDDDDDDNEDEDPIENVGWVRDKAIEILHCQLKDVSLTTVVQIYLNSRDHNEALARVVAHYKDFTPKYKDQAQHQGDCNAEAATANSVLIDNAVIHGDLDPIRTMGELYYNQETDSDSDSDGKRKRKRKHARGADAAKSVPPPPSKHQRRPRRNNRRREPASGPQAANARDSQPFAPTQEDVSQDY